MKLEGKKLLILGANPETADLVRIAKKMGVYTIVTDYNPNAPAKKVADKSYNVNGVDVDALEKLARDEQVDGLLIRLSDRTNSFVKGWGFRHTLKQRSKSACL